MEMNVDIQDAEDKFVPLFTPPTLQVLASYSVSRNLLFDSYRDHQSIEINDPLNNDFVRKVEYEVVVSIRKMRMDQPVEEILTRGTNKTLLAIKNFLRYFAKNFSFEDETGRDYSLRVADLKCFVWSGTGDVDYRETIMNVLATCGLSDLQKFAIFCEFCMLNEILDVPLDSLPESFVGYVNSAGFANFLLPYWIYFKRDELDSIPLGVHSSLAAKMAAKCLEKSTTWSESFEFFWNQLGVRKQIRLAVKIISASSKESRFHEGVKLFSVMSWHQQISVLAQMPDQIILKFWLHSESPQYAMWAWNHSKEQMTHVQFANVVQEIFKHKAHDEGTMKILIEIWRSASTGLKNLAVMVFANYVTLLFLSNPQPADPFSLYLDRLCGMKHDALTFVPCRTAFEFLYEFLSITNAEFRTTLITTHKHLFAISESDPRLFTEFIELCLPNTDQQTKFKQVVVNSVEMRRFSKILFASCMFDLLKLKLEFYLPNAESVRDYVKQLAQSIVVNKTEIVCQTAQWKRFCRFVEEMFPDRSEALEIERLLVLSFAPKYNHDRRWYDDRDLQCLNKVTKSVLSGEELITYKRNFLNELRQTVNDGPTMSYMRKFRFFDHDYFLKCLSWCTGDDVRDDILVFKNNQLSVDVVFDRIFADLVEYYEFRTAWYDCAIERLDKCLKWYLGGDELIKQYKLRRIRKPGDFKIFDMLSNEDQGSDSEARLFMERLLRWFFNGDQIAIEEFKASYRRVDSCLASEEDLVASWRDFFAIFTKNGSLCLLDLFHAIFFFFLGVLFLMIFYK